MTRCGHEEADSSRMLLQDDDGRILLRTCMDVVVLVVVCGVLLEATEDWVAFWPK